MTQIGYAILLENGKYHCAAHGYIATLYKTRKGAQKEIEQLQATRSRYGVGVIAAGLCPVYIGDVVPEAA